MPPEAHMKQRHEAEEEEILTNALKAHVDKQVGACRQDIFDQLKEMNHTLNTFVKAFPHNEDGEADFGGHRSYHEGLIRAAKAEEQFWTNLRQDMARKGVTGLLVIIIGLALLGLQAKIRMWMGQ